MSSGGHELVIGPNHGPPFSWHEMFQAAQPDPTPPLFIPAPTDTQHLPALTDPGALGGHHHLPQHDAAHVPLHPSSFAATGDGLSFANANPGPVVFGDAGSSISFGEPGNTFSFGGSG